MRALILERNKKISRRLARYFTSAGYEVDIVEDPAKVAASVDGVSILGADAFDGKLVVDTLAEHPDMRGILWTAEPLKRALRYAMDMPRLSNICGRKDFESTPRPWEIVMIASRLRDAGRDHDRQQASFSDYLDWGHAGFEERVQSTEHRDALVARVESYVASMGMPKRVSESLGELAHELLMNAMFDAPIDEQGKPKYANDRKASLVLPETEQPHFRVAADGTRVAVQVTDRFGRLRRNHIFNGLARGLDGGEIDTSHGGAGLGMVVCHNSTVAMFYDVIPEQKTEVTGIFDMDLNLREFRTRARSLHFFQA